MMEKANVMKGGIKMSKSKSEEEREWTVRKQDQKPHGKVKSFNELSKDPGQTNR
jgi:hypothetical protein